MLVPFSEKHNFMTQILGAGDWLVFPFLFTPLPVPFVPKFSDPTKALLRYRATPTLLEGDPYSPGDTMVPSGRA